MVHRVLKSFLNPLLCKPERLSDSLVKSEVGHVFADKKIWSNGIVMKYYGFNSIFRDIDYPVEALSLILEIL